MKEDPNLTQFPDTFQNAWLGWCAAPAPDAKFLARLEQQLQMQQAELLRPVRPEGAGLRTAWGKVARLVAVRRWRTALALAVILLAIGLLIVGPQRVLAQVQQWLHYVPGVGFIDLAETQVLPSPVEVTREGVTLRVDQVIAGRDRTRVVFSLPGFSEQSLTAAQKSASPGDFSASLGLPDGNRLEPERWQAAFGSGRLEFPPLPVGVNRVILVVPRLPLMMAGAMPENWEIPLTLIPAEGEAGASLFPEPYRLEKASDSHHGVTLRVLDVAQTADATALHYQLEWTDPGWQFFGSLGMERMPELRDNLGHGYWESPSSNSSVVSVGIAAPAPSQPAPTPSLPNTAGTLVFPSLSLYASQATLDVDSLSFSIPAQGTLRLDLGNHPMGEAWPLDASIDVAGFPVRLTGARLRQETVQAPDGRSEQRSLLEFDLGPIEEREGLSLVSITLMDESRGLYGFIGRTISGGKTTYKGRVEFQAGQTPTGVVTFDVTRADILVHGPWLVSWDVPGKEATAPVLPVHVSRAPVSKPGDVPQPVLEEALLSDRLTAVKLDAIGLPPGGTFLWVLPYDPFTYNPGQAISGLYLEDAWGRRYEAGRNLAFLRLNGDDPAYDPRWSLFAPLAPFAQRLTLHIPGMEILLPGKASFEVDVPEQVDFHPEEYTVMVVAGPGTGSQQTRTRWVSDIWPVDIYIDVAGCRLRLNQAQIERDEQSGPSYRLILTGNPVQRQQAGLSLISLRFAQVASPDGRVLAFDTASYESGLISYPFGGIGPVKPGSSEAQAMVHLDVTAANQADLLPGRYHVEISGVTGWIPGPWEIQFSASGN